MSTKEKSTISLNELLEKLKKMYEEDYQSYNTYLDIIWNGDFSALNLDFDEKDLENLDISIDSVELLYSISHGSFMFKNFKLCKKAFSELNKMCFTDFNRLSDQELKTLYNKHGAKYCHKPTQEEIIELLKTSYRHYFLERERILLRIYAESYEQDTQEIFEQCAKSQDEEIRVMCCANTNNIELFENDPSERIQKIMKLRTTIDEKINQLSAPEIQLMHDLLWAKKNKKFEIYDGAVRLKADEICVLIEGNMFKYCSFLGDRDIYWNIRDKRIMVYDLMQKIFSGLLEFKEGMEPYYYKDLEKERQSKK